METNEQDAKPASSVDKDEEDAITSSGNNGDRLMEKPSLQCGAFLVINPIQMKSESKPACKICRGKVTVKGSNTTNLFSHLKYWHSKE